MKLSNKKLLPHKVYQINAGSNCTMNVVYLYNRHGYLSKISNTIKTLLDNAVSFIAFPNNSLCVLVTHSYTATQKHAGY